MIKAFVVDEDNLERCKELLNTTTVPRRAIEHPTWIVWDGSMWAEARLLPHAVFKSIYEIVGHHDDYMVAEKI